MRRATWLWLAFRALPDQKFQTIGRSTDPVAARTLAADGRRYLYLVNRDYHPVRVRLNSAGRRAILVDTVSSKEIVIDGSAWIELGPYRSSRIRPPSPRCRQLPAYRRRRIP